jgi:hypothetical protein
VKKSLLSYFAFHWQEYERWIPKYRQVKAASGFPLEENRADSLNYRSKTLSLNFTRSDSSFGSPPAGSTVRAFRFFETVCGIKCRKLVNFNCNSGRYFGKTLKRTILVGESFMVLSKCSCPAAGSLMWGNWCYNSSRIPDTVFHDIAFW